MLTDAVAVDRALMLAFEGTRVPQDVAQLLGERDVAGFTLFPSHNVESSDQLRTLTATLQRARNSDHPLLIAADQEGGQLLGLGGFTTPFAGNMALGAAGDESLAERVARAMAREARALGVTVNYAPVCDVATKPANPSLGVRSFGDDPHAAARLAAAMVAGFQAEGVAATLKHFPGKGDADVDPHYELPALDHDAARLRSVEFVPFAAGIEAGAMLVMVGHYALRQITGRGELPSSLAREIVTGLCRRGLGFDGVVITDALDMHALPQGSLQTIDAIAALRAGADLLLFTPGRAHQETIRAALVQGVSRGLLATADLRASAARVAAVRAWIDRFGQPDLDVVRCTEHAKLAAELARRSVTLVRNDAGLVPLHLPTEASICVIVPTPRDLTPADTSSTVEPSLGRELRARHARTDELVVTSPPDDADIAAARDRARGHDIVVVATEHALGDPGQANLVRTLVADGVRVIAVALRGPWDLAVYPEVSTYLCTYSGHPDSTAALAESLWGEVPFRGRLPAAIPGIFPRGHGLTPPG